jgi:PAS domain S-box-containing protein
MSPIKVLLIDDDEDDYILTKEIFHDIPHREQYKLSWINNYTEGINAMLKSHYDIYLVDYRLGKHTGIDLLHEAIKSNVDEPIIILTGKGDAKVDNEALQIGAADYLIKDQINPYTIERSIRYALKHTNSLKALKESENKFRIIFERSKEPFLIIDSYGKIHDINQAGLHFFNYSRNEIQALNVAHLYANPENHHLFTQQIDETGTVNDFEVHLITKHKELRSVTISAFSQIDQHAIKELYYCIIHDLTNRKQVEQFSADIEKLAITERIAKNLANEIRNPLSSINLSLEQLKVDLNSDDESINLYLQIIQSNFETINALVSNLLYSTQNQQITTQQQSLNTILEEIIVKLQTEDDRNRVIISEAFSSQKIMVTVDIKQISEAISALLLYSINLGCNQITIASSLTKNHAYIEIRNDSPKLSQEEQKTIFEPFFNGKASGTGLINAKRIILSHKGKLEVETKFNKGFIFNISLPLSNRL